MNLKSSVARGYKANAEKYQVQGCQCYQADHKTTAHFAGQIASRADRLCMKKLTLGLVKFEFTGNSDIVRIGQAIGSFVL